MKLNRKLIILGGTLAGVVLPLPAYAQTSRAPEQKADLIRAISQAAPEDAAAAPDCVQPGDMKEAKVVDFDAANSVARLAVSLGSGRFTLVTIKTWARDGDARPLSPAVEAAKIMQGGLRLYSPKLTTNPASTLNEFLLVLDMGGGPVCWATPSALLTDAATPVAEAGKPAAVAVKETSPAVVTPAVAAGAPQVAVQPIRPRTPARRAEPADQTTTVQ